jgi:feruloyl esterase
MTAGNSMADQIRPAMTPKEIRSLTSYNFSILTAKIVPATDKIPEHCDVRGLILPEVRFAVKLPTKWNGRFYMVGNGGYAGRIRHERMVPGLMQGYATASTDTGHDGKLEPLGTFANRNKQKEIDYSFRAIHLTAVTAKEIIEAYYDEDIEYSYFVGCSTGGRQALMEAQRFPEDFDGIVAGAPVLDFTNIQMWGIWNAQALLSGPVALEKLPILAKAVYANCDGEDGLMDGLIEDPRDCTFDPAKDLPICAGDVDGADCFTKAQTTALKKVYEGVKNSKGELIFPGQPPGAEVFSEAPPYLGGGMKSGWHGWLIGSPSMQLLFGHSFMKFMAFEKDDREYDWKAFNFDTDPPKMAYMSSILDAKDPDLSIFKAHGGKLIQYHGWADTALTPLMTTDYYENVLNLMGAQTNDFYRLYMVPGMAHCSGGVGCGDVDWFAPLVNWVENGIAPEELIGAHKTAGKVDRTRPLCTYPEKAKYKGTGDINDASNFICVERE